MNGSSRMTNSADLPWWIVRPSLAAGLAASLALTVSAFHFAGLTHPAWTLTPRLLNGLMQLLSATPTLAAIGFLACALAFRRKQRRSSQFLCALLAIAALSGAWMNMARESRGVGTIERFIERALVETQPALAGK